MTTFYRLIVTHSHWAFILACTLPLLAAGMAWLLGGQPFEAGVYTFFAVMIAGGLFGIAGLIVCIIAMLWVMISLAFL